MKENQEYSTTVLQENILYCDNPEDFRKEILGGLRNQRILWQEKINAIIKENNYNLSSLAALCGVSRVAVKKWCDGALPQSRELFIRIGFAAGYSLDEMNRFLTRFGRFPALYPKSLEDSVYIFVLNSEKIPHTYAACEDVINRIRLFMQEDTEDGSCNDTVQMLTDLMNVETEAEMFAFVQENSPAYKKAYEKFYEYIKTFIEQNSKDAVSGKVCSLNALANYQGWSSSLRKCVSAIYQGSYFPMRRKVIGLGMFLNMDLEQMNCCLRLAHMEELYARNPLEGALIYALEDARLNDMIFCDGSVELKDYVCRTLRELEIPEAEEFILSLQA